MQDWVARFHKNLGIEGWKVVYQLLQYWIGGVGLVLNT